MLAVVIGPILMRPRGDEAMLRGQDTLVIITPHNEAIRSEFSEAFREWYRAKTGRTDPATTPPTPNFPRHENRR